MKALKKTLAILMVFSMVLSLGLVSAFAGGATPPSPSPSPTVENQYAGSQNPDNLVEVKETDPNKVTFKKFLVVPAGVPCPDVTFTFTIEGIANDITYTLATPASGGNPAVDGTMTVYATTGANSKVNGSPVFAANKDKATFGPTSATYTEVRKDANNDPTDIDVRRTAADRDKTLDASTGVQWESSKGEQYAVVEDLTLDFTGVTFVEPGIYRWIIRETSPSTNSAVMNDNHSFRVLDVYVVDENVTDTTAGTTEGKLKIASYVLHKGAGTSGDWKEDAAVKAGADMGSADVTNPGDKLGDKTDGFTNEYNPYTLVFGKQVTGNQGSRDKYFKFTVVLNNLVPGTYTISMADDGNPNTVDGYALAAPTKNNATTYEATVMGGANANGIDENTSVAGKQFVVATGETSKTLTFYLQHGQKIALWGLPAGTTYSVTEDAEDYKSEAAKAALADGDYKNAVSGTLSEVDKLDRDGTTSVYTAATTTEPAVDNRDRVVYTSYLNTRDGVIPTGILSVIAPAVAVIVLGAAGLGFVVASRRREEEAEEA